MNSAQILVEAETAAIETCIELKNAVSLLLQKVHVGALTNRVDLLESELTATKMALAELTPLTTKTTVEEREESIEESRHTVTADIHIADCDDRQETPINHTPFQYSKSEHKRLARGLLKSKVKTCDRDTQTTSHHPG